jgi:ABC-type branched-subunit amino acid transport system ATPase component
MRIRKIKIENYKSLRNVDLDEIGDLIILIGSNNAGKTSLLELLNRFFTEIDMTGVPSGIDNYCWYDGDVERDIRVTVTLEFDKPELEEVFPVEALTLIRETKQENAVRMVTISRRIVKPPTGWQPQDLAFGDILVMKDGKIVAPADFLPIPYEFQAVLFNPEASKDNLIGNRIILVSPQKKAYLMGVYADGLAMEGKAEVINVSDKAQDPKEYVRNEGYELVERELTEAELKSLQPITQQTLQTIVTNLISRLKGRFKLIPSVRDAWPQNPLVRSTSLDPETQSLFRSLGISDGTKERKRWYDIRAEFRAAFDAEFGIHPNYLATEEADLRIPIQHSGGGNQEFLILMRYLSEGNFMFGVEEPELHLHPQLARRVFDVFKKMSEENQIFLSTHSTIFVDQAELTNTWIVKKRGKETNIDRIKSDEDLRRILFELGVRPSDIFFSNGVVFVEGPSDRDVYTTLADKIGIDFRKIQVAIIPTYGKSSGRYHLRVWTDVAKNANIPYFMVLDKGAEMEAKALVADGVLTPDQNLFILKRGSLEAYYPLNLFVSAFEDEYGIKLDANEGKTIESRDSKKIEELLRSKEIDPEGWKVLTGRRVSQKMNAKEIDDEIKRILERLRTQLSLP